MEERPNPRAPDVLHLQSARHVRLENIPHGRGETPPSPRQEGPGSCLFWLKRVGDGKRPLSPPLGGLAQV